MSASTHTSLETHPDIVALRERYDHAGGQAPVQVADGLLMLSGLYAAASAWIVGFAGQTSLTISNLICGIAIAVLALAYGSAYGRTHGIAFVAPLLGVWLIVSPWIVSGVGTTAGMIWSNVAVGAAVCVLGLRTVALAMSRPARTR
ncbi:SPW repeat protein [Nocardia grenadensis]|uniref:SPW repeat protein n=1 Tax=Nocardia grenadensis TaxID=931537 RepID=UPI003D92892E